MAYLHPYAGEEAPSEVGFTWRGRKYTPDSPCSIFDDFYCTREDWANWKGHTLEWLDRVKRVDPERYRRMAAGYADLVARNDGDAKARLSAIQALVSTARLARAILEEAKELPSDITSDLGEGGDSVLWSIGEDVVGEVSNMFEQAKKDIEGHLQSRWSIYLLVGGALLWLYMGGRRR